MTPETQVRTLAQRILDFDYGYADQTNTEWRAIVNEARAMTTNTRGSTPAQTGKAEHTPGPWEVERPFGEPGLYVQARDTSLVVKVYGENEANARLVAAAPQLLEALRETANLAESYRQDDAYPWTDENERTYQQARAAIKAAEGE